MWINAILLTLLFFLICIGFGLFILAMSSIAVIGQSRLTRLQLIVLGLTIGGPGASVFLQILSLLSQNLYADLGIVLLISLIGFGATAHIWYPRKEDRKQIALWAALSIPLALITWWWSFGAFSGFPYGDIGADVHWIKTAQEYADTGIINPYASQSYTDLRTALAGALSGVLGLDLLRFNWTYRYFSIFGLMVFFYAVADGIFLDRRKKWFAFFFAAASNTLGLLTNGSLAVASSLVFLSALLKPDAEPHQPRTSATSALLVTVGAFASILLTFFINNNALVLALIAATALAFRLLNRIGNRAKSLVSVAFISVMWPMALTLSHRGAYLFVPVTMAAWLLWLIICSLVSKASIGSIRTLWALSLALPLACLGILSAVIAARLGYLSSMQGSQLFSRITLLIVGKPIQPGDDIILGAGPDVAAIELGRAIGPFFALGIGLAILSWCAIRLQARVRQPIGPSSESRNDALLLWSWISGCGLSLAALSGFPFLYRVDFIICGLFAIATTELFFQLFVDKVADGSNRRRVVAVIAAATVAAFVGGVYSSDWASSAPYSGYQEMLRPLEVAGIGLVLLFAALTFAPARRLQILGLAVTISLGVALDRSVLSATFKVYSYGRLPEHTMAIAHYDASDLKTDRWLRDNMHDFIIVSDPYTLGFAQAITGEPGAYLFSNLDTVNEALADQVKDVISAIASTGNPKIRAFQACASLSPLLANLNDEARARIYGSNLAQGILKPVKPGKAISEKELLGAAVPHNRDDILRQLNVLSEAGGKWKAVAIINPRTIQWLHLKSGERLPYFPIDRSLQGDVLKRLSEGPFRTLFSDNQNVVLLVECTKAALPLDSNGF